jgi:SET domain
VHWSSFSLSSVTLLLLSIAGFALGLDAAINCHPALFNAAKKYPSYDFLDLHRHHDPGTGAFTPYHNASSYMTHATPAGAEIFKKYGDDWFLTREETMGLIPLTKDYKTMEALLRHLHDVFEEHELSNETQYDLWNFLVSWSRYSDSRTMMALPKSFDDFQRVIEDGIRAIHLPQSIRTLEDLETNGRCMDHLRPGPSTIRQAGRGAFATRPLAKNSIVTGTPVLFIPTDDVFKLYEGDWFTKNNEAFRPDRLKGYQILYNYCWHPEGNMSSIFLCPYGIHVSYINHNRSLANVRVQWASDGAMNHNATLLELSPAAMYLSDAPRLWLDFIATRDIAVGEEIFLDYGAAWEAAWTAHLAAWNREAQYSADYMTADAWNEAYAEAVLSTDEEQKTEPYPGNLRMICLPQIADATLSEFLKDERCSRAWKPGTEGIPCRIIQRDVVKEEDGESVSYQYHVLYLSTEEDDDDGKWAESEDWVVREAIRFFDAPYSSDLFLEQAFRHPIGFPDEIFPKAWRGVFLSPLPELGKKAKEKPTKSMVATLLSYLKH